MKLKIVNKLVFICITGLLLSACQKEVDLQNEGEQGPGSGSNNNVDITGNWKFVGLSADTRVDITVSQAGQNLKAITTSSYSSANNTGTLTVTSNQFIYAGISATVEGEQNVKTYLNGILFDDQTMPYN